MQKRKSERSVSTIAVAACIGLLILAVFRTSLHAETITTTTINTPNRAVCATKNN